MTVLRLFSRREPEVHHHHHVVIVPAGDEASLIAALHEALVRADYQLRYNGIPVPPEVAAALALVRGDRNQR